MVALDTIYNIVLLTCFSYSLFLTYRKTDTYGLTLIIGVGVFMDIIEPRIDHILPALKTQHNFLIVGYTLLLSFYSSYIFKRLLANNFLKKLTLLFLFITLIGDSYLWITSLNQNKYSQDLLLLNAIFILIVAIIYYINLLLINRIVIIVEDFGFWITSSFFVWSIGFILKMGIFYFFFENSKPYFNIINTIFTLANIFSYILIFNALRCLKPMK